MCVCVCVFLLDDREQRSFVIPVDKRVHGGAVADREQIQLVSTSQAEARQTKS